jgi:UDP:flavonoid glycosyltransferase YjiC (YdhE family)
MRQIAHLSAIALSTSAILAANAAFAQGEEGSWGYFEPEGEPMQAGVATADGAQIILKCDETGSNTVYVALVAPRMIAAPSARPRARDLRLRFDDGPPRTVAWQYYEQSAVARNNTRDRQLPLFLQLLADADTLEVQFNPVDGSPFDVHYTVTGTRAAAARVYESCGDSTNPIAAQ